ncbi:MAG: hypothetical protein MK137_07915 [Rickettsiales bacterium]|nr:hypothetical protein [Rickettsiales bacterium]
MSTDPIKLSQIRDDVRTRKHRLVGITKCIKAVSMTSMDQDDKRITIDLLNDLRNQAADQYKEAIQKEDEYTNSGDRFLDNAFPFIH